MEEKKIIGETPDIWMLYEILHYSQELFTPLIEIQDINSKRFNIILQQRKNTYRKPKRRFQDIIDNNPSELQGEVTLLRKGFVLFRFPYLLSVFTRDQAEKCIDRLIKEKVIVSGYQNIRGRYIPIDSNDQEANELLYKACDPKLTMAFGNFDYFLKIDTEICTNVFHQKISTWINNEKSKRFGIMDTFKSTKQIQIVVEELFDMIENYPQESIYFPHNKFLEEPLNTSAVIILLDILGYISIRRTFSHMMNFKNKLFIRVYDQFITDFTGEGNNIFGIKIDPNAKKKKVLESIEKEGYKELERNIPLQSSDKNTPHYTYKNIELYCSPDETRVSYFMCDGKIFRPPSDTKKFRKPDHIILIKIFKLKGIVFLKLDIEEILIEHSLDKIDPRTGELIVIDKSREVWRSLSRIKKAFPFLNIKTKRSEGYYLG